MLLMRAAESLVDCPKRVIDFALMAHVDLRQRVDYPIEFLSGLERAMWVEMEGKVAGIWLWTVQDHGRRWWVDFCAVAPWAQKKGVYKEMRARFTALAKKDPLCRAFESHVASGNVRMRELNERAGSKPVSIKYRCEVKS